MRFKDEEELEAFIKARHELWLGIVTGLHLEEIVFWIDKQLRRWPWLYRRLGG